MINFIKKIKNRIIGRKEHESIETVYYLPFNAELQKRLNYKKSLLVNDIFEHLQLDKNCINIIFVNNLIENGKNNGLIDTFYNKILNGKIV